MAALVAATFWLGAHTPGHAAPKAQVACGDVDVRSPQQGDVLQGSVPIYGSARIPDFNFYKVEFAPAANPESWSAVSSTKPSPVIGGVLDIWNTQTVPDGEYYIKLTAVDSVGQEVCRVTVPSLLVANEGTPTPTGTATPEESPTPTLTPLPQSPDATVEPTAVPTLEAIVSSESQGSLVGDVASELGDLGIMSNFVKGFAGMLVVATVLAFLVWLRSG